MRRRGRLAALAAPLAGLWLLATGPAAAAHGVLESSEPAGGSSLERAPAAVTLRFSERPDPGLSTVRVLDSGGRAVAGGPARPVAGRPLELRVPLAGLPAGGYTVSWRIVSAVDGHRTDGVFGFGVGAAGAPQLAASQTVAGSPTGPALSPLAVAGRWAWYWGLALLVGAAATGLLVFGGRLPGRPAVLLGLALAAAAAGLVAMTAAAASAAAVSLPDLLTSTTGRWLLWRAATLAAAVGTTWWLLSRRPPATPLLVPRSRQAAPGALATRAGTPDPAMSLATVPAWAAASSTTMAPATPEPHPPMPEPPAPVAGAPDPHRVIAGAPDPHRLIPGPPNREGSPTPEQGAPVVHTPRGALVALGAAAGAGMLAHALAGHAAGPSSLRALNLAAQWTHLLAVGVWIGGLVWLLAALWMRAAPWSTRQVVVRFSKLAGSSLAVVVVTGVARTIDELGGWGRLVDSGFGRALDLKLVLFAALVALGARNHFRLVPLFKTGARRRAATRLRRSVGAELGLAAGVLAAAALLSQLAPGVPAGAARPGPAAAPALEASGADWATTVRVTVTVTPGAAGPNRFTATVADFDSGSVLPAERVELTGTPESHPEVGTARLELAEAPDGRWLGQGHLLSLAGRWNLTATVQRPTGGITVPLAVDVPPPAPP
jgi:copper transport protein